MAEMIGKRIRLARLHRNLTLRELGEALNVSPQAVAQWEKGSPNLSDDRSYRLANTLDVDIDWLRGLRGEDDIVFISSNRAHFEDKVPLISYYDSLKYFALSRNPHRDLEYETTLIPTVKIIGQGFAVQIPETNAIPPHVMEGDILIFDNGIKPSDGDIVICLSLHAGLYHTVLAMCMSEDDGTLHKRQSDLVLTATQGSEAERRLDEFGGATPIAVMTELRRLRREPLRPRGESSGRKRSP